MLTSDQITELFFLVDEYCLLFEKNINHNLIKVCSSAAKRSRNKSCGLSKSEVITLLIAFHQSDYRTLKHFYKDYVCVHLQKEFPSLVSYNRFVELQKLAALPLFMFVMSHCIGECTGISFIDSTKVAVCKNQRIRQHGNLKTWPKEGILPLAGPQANVDMRVGGPFDVLMRSPQGEEHWVRGRIVEVTPPSRLVFDSTVTDAAGTPLFSAYTEIELTEAPGGTRIDVTQKYTVLKPGMEWMPEGAPQGWASTIEQLAAEAAAMERDALGSARSVAFGTFSLKRSYDAPVARVWKALTDQAAKQKWFGGDGAQFEPFERSMDVRPGGRERLKGRWAGGLVTTFDAVYHDVVAQERLVYSYEMHLDERKISVSLATMELVSEGAGTTLEGHRAGRVPRRL